MILLIDNYDSFSYNLYQLIGSLNPDIRVVRNDELTVEEIDALNPEAIILSPGPGRPEDAGVCVDVVCRLGAKYRILGVCLGHQAICLANGAVVGYAKQLMHGKQSDVKLDTSCTLFAGCREVEPVARYHSLAVDKRTMPDTLLSIGETEDGEVMAVKHRDYEVYGLQFHPESILTPAGRTMLQNFLGGREND